MTAAVIRKATQDDLDIILEFSQKLFESDDQWFHNSNMDWTYSADGREFNKSFLAGDEKVCFIAEIDGGPVGYVTGRVEPVNSAFPGTATRLMNIYVDDKNRSAGVGRQLTDQFYEWSRQQVADRVFVHAYTLNQRAQSFYKQQGFELYESILWHKL